MLSPRKPRGYSFSVELTLHKIPQIPQGPHPVSPVQEHTSVLPQQHLTACISVLFSLRGIPTRKGKLPDSTTWSCRLQAGTWRRFIGAQGNGDSSVVMHPPTLPRAALSGLGGQCSTLHHSRWCGNTRGISLEKVTSTLFFWFNHTKWKSEILDRKGSRQSQREK